MRKSFSRSWLIYSNQWLTCRRGTRFQIKYPRSSHVIALLMRVVDSWWVTLGEQMQLYGGQSFPRTPSLPHPPPPVRYRHSFFLFHLSPPAVCMNKVTRVMERTRKCSQWATPLEHIKKKYLYIKSRQFSRKSLGWWNRYEPYERMFYIQPFLFWAHSNTRAILLEFQIQTLPWRKKLLFSQTLQ